MNGIEIGIGIEIQIEIEIWTAGRSVAVAVVVVDDCETPFEVWHESGVFFAVSNEYEYGNGTLTVNWTVKNPDCRLQHDDSGRECPISSGQESESASGIDDHLVGHSRC